MTWAGPALGEDFGVEGEPDDIMQACFDDLVSGQGEGTGWQLPRPESVGEEAVELKGELWGGNLSVLTTLVGTPWMPDVKSGILFLEDVHEHPYRVERMLTQLLYAGVLGRQKAILLGHFTNYKPYPHDKGYRLQTVVDWLRRQVKTPVLTNLPFGHVATKVRCRWVPRCTWRWKAGMRSCFGVTATRRLGVRGPRELGREFSPLGSSPRNFLVMRAIVFAGRQLAMHRGQSSHEVASQVPQGLDIARIADAAGDLRELLGS